MPFGLFIYLFYTINFNKIIINLQIIFNVSLIKKSDFRNSTNRHARIDIHLAHIRTSFYLRSIKS